MKIVKCLDCEFYDKQNSENSYGICHRFPPNEANRRTGRFIGVNPTDWCGEYKEAVMAAEAVIDEIKRPVGRPKKVEVLDAEGTGTKVEA